LCRPLCFLCPCSPLMREPLLFLDCLMFLPIIAFLSHCCFNGVFASLRPVIFVSVVRGIPVVAGFPAVTGKLTIIKNPSY
jgi:hypothetical protein